VSLM
jgi:hypothetical protein